MKRFLFFLLLFLLSFSLVGCGKDFPVVNSSYISPYKWETSDQGDIYALSPDGNNLVLNNLVQVDVSTGAESKPFDGYLHSTTNPILQWVPKGWSVDGRYLAVLGINNQRIGNPRPIYLFDTKTHSAAQTAEDISVYFIWSPFDPQSYIAGTFDGSYKFRVNDDTRLPYDNLVDYRQYKEFGGTGIGPTSFLWSKELNRPVAYLVWYPFPTSAEPDKQPDQLYLASYAYPIRSVTPANLSPTGFRPEGANQVINYLFDPTGEYVLVVEWKCIANEKNPCTTENTENVTDTVLTIIKWKTQEERELFHLSEIDPKHVVASSLLAWSADGSTIVMGRDNASAVVLKIKYP